MLQQELEKVVCSYFSTSPLNTIAAQQALEPVCAGVKIFDEPLIAYGHPDDTLFKELKKRVLGRHFRLPSDWCHGCKTVISIFAPLSSVIVTSNTFDSEYPSNLWLHGRYEGQQCLVQLAKVVEKFLQDAGFATVCPCLSEDFMAVHEGEGLAFTSNWSERHVAYICGIGTFSLTKGIITVKGMAGRLISLVTAADFEKTPRAYTELYEYCAQCGACIARCPVQAISFEKGKEHLPCSRLLDSILAQNSPRYACGKCQTNVPCARKIPRKAKVNLS